MVEAHLWHAVAGTLFTWGVTALGAAVVFLFPADTTVCVQAEYAWFTRSINYSNAHRLQHI